MRIFVDKWLPYIVKPGAPKTEEMPEEDKHLQSLLRVLKMCRG